MIMNIEVIIIIILVFVILYLVNDNIVYRSVLKRTREQLFMFTDKVIKDSKSNSSISNEEYIYVDDLSINSNVDKLQITDAYISPLGRFYIFYKRKDGCSITNHPKSVVLVNSINKQAEEYNNKI